MLLLILLAELLALFILSRTVTGNLFGFVLRLTGSRRVAISFVSIVLYPGTVIHELAHLFTAEVLGVHTGKLTLVPEGITDENEVRSGSVMIEHTDPLRRAMIGLAPFTTGLFFCAAIAYFYSLPLSWFQQTFHFTPASPAGGLSTLHFSLLRALLLYLLFSVSTSMFPSSTDMKGAWAIGIVMLILVIAGFVAGVKIAITGVMAEALSTLIGSAVQTFFLVLLIQFGLWIFTKIFLKFVR